MARKDLLVWMDMEFSGLEPDTDVVLEMATIITDNNLDILAEGPVLAIHQSDEILNNMDEWNTSHHGASGLTERVRQSKISHDDADKLTCDFILEHCEPSSSPLCGNSIHQDRRFLYKYMPKCSEALHYRNIDVSTFKELDKRWNPDNSKFKKKNVHLALDDIRESIEELKFYKNLWKI